MKKYTYKPFVYQKRNWPNQTITEAPIWCSVDLRDGNQALVNPMNLKKKVTFFKKLIDMNFKEIEVGFPAASGVEYDFVRYLIDNNLIPNDVTIQVLTQARENLIKKTMQSIIGAKNVIVHVYNSTSVAQRKIVFQKNKSEIIKIATEGVKCIKKNLTDQHQNITLQYSPESFTGTELEFSLAICEAVMDEWPKKKIIINLPATVELFGPHVYADMIEWFNKNIKERERVVLSLHTHNDRGTGIAASELGLLAGAQRVEGTLFGNGERTGNVDIVAMALNLYSHGIDPKLNVYNIPDLVKFSELYTEIPVYQRHPYGGELVFTAFSGSHQDAINKGISHHKQNPNSLWEVPYLTIDPQDIGRTYEAIIRINSQSGKGGTAYVMESDYGFHLPRQLQIHFSKIVQKYAEQVDREVLSDEIYSLFTSTYISPKQLPFLYQSMKPEYIKTDHVKIELILTDQQDLHTVNTVKKNEKEKVLSIFGEGNGPVDAAKLALTKVCGEFDIVNYHEHSLSEGANASAVSYIELIYNDNNTTKHVFGAGIDKNITVSSIKALVCCSAKLLAEKTK